MIEDVANFYAAHMREALFGASVTIGTFIFTMKAFIVKMLKTSLYDHPKYHEHVKSQARVRTSTDVYAPLRNLSRVLVAVVSAAFINAALQFTVGAVWLPVGAIICLATSVFTGALVAASIWLVSVNLTDLLKFSSQNPPPG